MDPMVEAIKQVAELGLKNDKDILEVVKSLIERHVILEERVHSLEKALSASGMRH